MSFIVPCSIVALVMVCSHCPTPTPLPLPTPSLTTMDLMIICRAVHTEPTQTQTQTQTPSQMQLGFIPILSADNSTDNVRNNGFKTISTVLWLSFVIYTIKISSAKCRTIIVFQHFELEERKYCIEGGCYYFMYSSKLITSPEKYGFTL